MMSKERLEEIIKQVKRNEELKYLEKEYEVRRVCYLEEHIKRLEKEKKRYRESIEHTKLKLKDFRRGANNTFKLIDTRNRAAKDEAFRLQCDIRDCLEAIDKKPVDRTVESPHSTWF